MTPALRCALLSGLVVTLSPSLTSAQPCVGGDADLLVEGLRELGAEIADAVRRGIDERGLAACSAPDEAEPPLGVLVVSRRPGEGIDLVLLDLAASRRGEREVPLDGIDASAWVIAVAIAVGELLRGHATALGRVRDEVLSGARALPPDLGARAREVADRGTIAEADPGESLQASEAPERRDAEGSEPDETLDPSESQGRWSVALAIEGAYFPEDPRELGGTLASGRRWGRVSGRLGLHGRWGAPRTPDGNATLRRALLAGSAGVSFTIAKTTRLTLDLAADALAGVALLRADERAAQPIVRVRTLAELLLGRGPWRPLIFAGAALRAVLPRASAVGAADVPVVNDGAVVGVLVGLGVRLQLGGDPTTLRAAVAEDG